MVGPANQGPSPLWTSYADASIERLEEARALLDAGNYVGSIYLSGCAIESILKAFIDSKGDDIKGHNLAKLAEQANMTRRLKPAYREAVDAAISEATPLWRNLFRYCTPSDLNRMGCEMKLRFEHEGRLIRYSEAPSNRLELWATRMYNLASSVVQQGRNLWLSKKL